MVRTFLKVYMELGSYFLFLQEQIKDIIIICCKPARLLQLAPSGGRPRRLNATAPPRIAPPHQQRLTALED